MGNLLLVLAAEEPVEPHLERMVAVIGDHELSPTRLPLSAGWGDAHRQLLSARVVATAREIVDMAQHQLRAQGR
ncbi:hypothetical protein J2X45_003379 [Caulobacter sp. BE264]|nr:hypothetical protein [Caulobacter sp. BE264]